MNINMPQISKSGTTIAMDKSQSESLALAPSRSDSLSGTGSIFRLEQQFKQHFGFDHALTVCNATLGLMAAFDVCSIKNAEVIVPPYTWGGSLSGLLYLWNRPVFADIDKETLTLDPKSVRECITSRTKAILAVDIYGNPCHAEELRKIADEFGLLFIQDCAQSFGATIDGHQSGQLADMSVFSFSPGKDLQASSGAMICCQDSSLYEKLVWCTQHPDRQKRDIPEMLPNQFALNLRMDAFAAASVSKRFEQQLEAVRVRQVALEKLERYLESLYGWNTLFSEKYRPSGYRFTIDTSSLNRDKMFIEALVELGIRGSIEYPPITQLLFDDPGFISFSKDNRPICPVAQCAVKNRMLFIFDDIVSDVKSGC